MRQERRDHERGTKAEWQEVFLDGIRRKGALCVDHSGDHCECCCSLCDCTDRRAITGIGLYRRIDTPPMIRSRAAFVAEQRGAIREKLLGLFPS